VLGVRGREPQAAQAAAPHALEQVREPGAGVAVRVDGLAQQQDLG
jgi:hypothetical protein